MAASGHPRGRISVGQVINETFTIYTEHFSVLVLSAAGVFIVIGVLTGILQHSGGIVLGVIATIIQLAARALYTGFVVQLVQDVRDGRRDQTVGDLFSAAAPSIVALIAFGIIFGIGVAIGLILIIIPGLILLTFWSVGAPAIVVEKTGPIQAFGRSWRLVRGDAWTVFGVLVVVLLIIIVVGVVLGIIGALIGAGGVIVAAIITSVFTAPISALAISVMFFDLGGGQNAPSGPLASDTPAGPSGPIA